MTDALAARALRGLVLGTAVGDALGLPMEGLGPRRAARLFPGPPRQRLLPGGGGLCSDDTEHMLFAAQALLAHPHEVAAFRRSLAWRLRGWLWGLPAGVGLATLRAIARMHLGLREPGVRSAGNGPAMRAPVLGAALAHDPARRVAYVAASTRLTHIDPRALTGALAVAELAAWAARQRRLDRPPLDELLELLAPLAPRQDEAWSMWLAAIATGLERGDDVATFAANMGLARGVTGYIYHSVPLAIYAWHVHFGDYAATLAAVVALGGDTDSVGAIAGALAGAVVGEAGIPTAWRAGLREWPRGERVWLEVADRLAGEGPYAPVSYAWVALLPRNVLFLAVVLVHGFRRLLPPY